MTVGSLKPPCLWKLSAREMQRRPGRTLLTLLGIVLGVGAIVSITLTTATTQRAYKEMFASVAGRAALEVVAEGFGSFDESLVPRLQTVPGVKTAVPVVQVPTVLLGPSGGVSALAMGVEENTDAAARDYVLREGRALGGQEGVLLEAGFARAQGCEVGQPARLLTPQLTPTGPLIAQLPVIGLLEPGGAAAFNGGAVVFMPLPTAQRLFGRKGQINSVQLVLNEGANAHQVEAEVRKILPTGLTVQTPASRGEMAQDSLLSTQLGLGTLSLLSLVAGAFVILNSFLMNLGERRKQLAILRSLGATRSQVTRLLLREAVVLGASGTLLGIPVGLAFSIVLRQVMEQLLGVVLPPTHWTPAPFLYALLLGPGMALAATFVPARRAGKRAPLDDLLHQRGAPEEKPRRLAAYVGLALLIGISASVGGLILDWYPPALTPWLLGPILALGLIGSVLAIPLILGPLNSFTAWLLRPLLGMEGRLALRQLGRYPTRTALTVGILFIGEVVSIGFGQSMLNTVRNIYLWCDQNIAFDFMIRGVMPDTTLITAGPLPEDLGEQLARLDGVERVDKVNFVLARAQGRQIVVIPCGLEGGRPLPFALATGDVQEARRGFLQGEVILGTALAHRLGLDVGDTISLDTRQGPQALRIAGTTSEYTVGGMVLYMEWNKGKKLFDLQGVHVFTVMAKKGAVPDLAPWLEACCKEHGLRCQSNADFRALLDKSIGGVAGLYWGLVVLVFVVASLGIVNTLTMNVLEQTRELGILRAIAMKRGQLRKLILSQALALGVMSLVPGIAVGIALAYLMNQGARPVLGIAVAFHLDASLVGGCFLAALAIVLLAAFFPARRAARIQIIRALQYE